MDAYDRGYRDGIRAARSEVWLLTSSGHQSANDMRKLWFKLDEMIKEAADES